MANEEHLTLLEQGIVAWNQWRQDATEQPDLSGVNLRGKNLNRLNLAQANLQGTDLRNAELCYADFTGANLHRVNLNEAYLIQANLSQADLSGASLIEAHLAEANLAEANLAGVNLTGGDLKKANLSNANLSRTDLSEANFFGANLNSAGLDFATLGSTIFANTDLTDVKGLSSCHHKEPSIVDHQTVVRSRNLDPTFLHQCGIPQQVADCLLLLPHQPLQTSIVSQVVADNPPRRAELYHVFPISKTYEPKQGFLLDEKKLQRIHDILLTGLNRCRDQSCLIYEVFRADHSYLKTSRVEDVFKEGNKNLKRITRISISNEHSNELKLELVFQKLSSGGHTVLKVEGDKAEATVPAYEALQQYLASQVNVVKDQSKIRLLLSIKMGLLFFLNLTALQPLSKQYPILAASVNTITNVTAILAILIALIGGLKWYFGPELVNDYLFPDSFFLFGQETNHYRKIQELRKTVILSFVIASVLGILVNLYTS